jgi:hypothetical protein
MLYSTFTAFLGFAVNEGEYKVMGLASYGTPRFADQVRKVIRRTSDGAFALDLKFFEFHTTVARSYSAAFVDAFGPPRASWDPIDLTSEAGQRYADIAASVQLVLEEILVDLTSQLHRETRLSGPLPGRRGGAERRGQCADPARERLCAACSCRRRRATPAAPWARRSTPTASTSEIRTGRSRTIRSGARPSATASWRRSPARTASTWRR